MEFPVVDLWGPQGPAPPNVCDIVGLYNKHPERSIKEHWWSSVTYYYPTPPCLNVFSGFTTDLLIAARL